MQTKKRRKRIEDLTPEECAAEAEALRPARRKADRDFTGLWFIQQIENELGIEIEFGGGEGEQN